MAPQLVLCCIVDLGMLCTTPALGVRLFCYANLAGVKSTVCCIIMCWVGERLVVVDTLGHFQIKPVFVCGESREVFIWDMPSIKKRESQGAKCTRSMVFVAHGRLPAYCILLNLVVYPWSRPRIKTGHSEKPSFGNWRGNRSASSIARVVSPRNSIICCINNSIRSRNYFSSLK